MWDAGQYLRFGGERARPFFDLVAQVGATGPGYVADLGCGPGNLTAALAERWPGATVVGVDNSPEMIAAAQSAVPQAASEKRSVTRVPGAIALYSTSEPRVVAIACTMRVPRPVP